METFGTFREPIERDLTEIVGLAKSNPKVDTNNLFAVGFSNGGFWVRFLTGKSLVNAGVSHYGVWKANFGGSILTLIQWNIFQSPVRLSLPYMVTATKLKG